VEPRTGNLNGATKGILFALCFYALTHGNKAMCPTWAKGIPDVIDRDLAIHGLCSTMSSIRWTQKFYLRRLKKISTPEQKEKPSDFFEL
jgi:hypothetical protein